MRISHSIFCCMMLFSVSSSVWAEYYLVRTLADRCAPRYSSQQRYHHYKDEQVFTGHHSYSLSKSQISQSRIAAKSHTISYNLDLITGDDDPYTYPGMNVDR